MTPREYEALEQNILVTLQQTGRFGPIEKNTSIRTVIACPSSSTACCSRHRTARTKSGASSRTTPSASTPSRLCANPRKIPRAIRGFQPGRDAARRTPISRSEPGHRADSWLIRPPELIGLHPAMTSPPVQPNGDDTATLAQKYIQECLSKGHVRLEWAARRKNGEDIPVEVILTRVQWGGKQIIQAAVNEISERKQAEASC